MIKYSWNLYKKILNHFFNTFNAFIVYYFDYSSNGNKFGLAFGILPFPWPWRYVVGDLFNYSRFDSFILFFFWYFNICWAANSNIFAYGRPFLHIARKKYS